jgi:hypothetical protein
MEDLEPSAKTDCICAAISELGQIYSDLTGRFPTQSASGNKYIRVLYDYVSNSALTYPMKERRKKEALASYAHLITCLTNWGLKPHLQRLYNKT